MAAPVRPPPYAFLLAAWAMILAWSCTFPVAAFVVITPGPSPHPESWLFYFAIEAVVLAGLSWFFYGRFKRPGIAALCWVTNALIIILGFGLVIAMRQPQMILGFFALSVFLQLKMRPRAN